MKRTTLGFIRWNASSGENHKYKMNCVRYVNWSQLPRTAAEYLRLARLKNPGPNHTDVFGKKFWNDFTEQLDKAITLPEARLKNTLAQKKKKDKDKETKEEPESEESKKARQKRVSAATLNVMPPAALDGAWYAVVRVEFEEDSEIRTILKDIVATIICKEQLTR